MPFQTHCCYDNDSLSNRGPRAYSTMLQASVGDPLDRYRPFSGYSKHYWSIQIPKDAWNDLVWVNRWHNPKDLRSSNPVPRHKFLTQPKLHKLPSHWVPLTEAPLSAFSRAKEEKGIYNTTPSSRCEQWSTLRQMFPSRGHSQHKLPAKWGTDKAALSNWSPFKPKRFPHINSSMTKYV